MMSAGGAGMTFRISKEFHFSASHRLDGLPDGHPCSRLHGHNYVVELELCATVDDLGGVGFVRDYGELKDFSRWLESDVDHRHLNDLLTDRNPSAENLARWLFDRWQPRFPELSSVRVSETPKTWAEYRP
jgi:6-pyruvoyltetrahydropterin/6-carboxytetrahydropterin synthase